MRQDNTNGTPFVVQWRKYFYGPLGPEDTSVPKLDPPLSANAQHVAFALAMHMDRAGFCAVGLRRLATEMGRGRNCIAARIEELIDRGLLEVVRKGTGTAATEYAGTLPSGSIGVPQGGASGSIGVPQGERASGSIGVPQGERASGSIEDASGSIERASGSTVEPEQENKKNKRARGDDPELFAIALEWAREKGARNQKGLANKILTEDRDDLLAELARRRCHQKCRACDGSGSIERYSQGSGKYYRTPCPENPDERGEATA